MSHFDILNKVMCSGNPPALDGRVLVRDTPGGARILNRGGLLITATTSGLWTCIGTIHEDDFIAESHLPVYCYELEDRDSYIEEQRRWVSKNRILTGSLVKVTRRAYNRQRGWDNTWADVMDSYIGSTLSVMDIHRATGIRLTNCLRFPYFVLEPAC